MMLQNIFAHDAAFAQLKHKLLHYLQYFVSHESNEVNQYDVSFAMDCGESR